MKASRIHALIIFSIALDLCQCRAYGQQPRGNAGKITVAVVQATSATILQPYPCRVDSAAPVFVRSPVKGRVAAILVKEGQAVKRGDLLFKVKPDGDELKPLAKDGDRIVSIKAPCSGLVKGFRGPGPGDPVGKGTHVLTLGDDSVMRVHFDISEKHYLELMKERGLDWINEDLHLILADHGNYPHVGKIVGILGGRSNNDDPSRFSLYTEFPNPDGVLHRGQTCTLLIRRRVKDAILIPRQATFDGPGIWRRSDRVPILTWSGRLRHSGTPVAACLGSIVARFEPIATFLEDIGARFEIYTARYAYIVDENHVAHRRRITVEDNANDVLIVRKGIGVGDRIVVDGVGRVSDGDKVE
jgi:membrane fusion protein (multidrug efflux system)